ncbi:MAG: NAD(P)H-dependent oxidoreductase [Gammaproteobacteria bacterium]|nr:NAD(P)H-dependent oxidoreductase [Gammaproteobacteria bacterium]
MKPRAHLIIAHPKKESFNYALAELAQNYLHDKNFDVVITDIYDLYQKQHAAVSPFQFSRSDPEIKQIKSEQAKIKSSQLTLVQFPLYWYSVPGLLKNYMDSVWELNFAFTPPDGVFEKSPIADGRKIMLSLSTQTPKEKYIAEEILGPMENILHPIELAFKFIGYNTLPAFVTYNIEGKSPSALEPEKQRFIQHLSSNIQSV